MCVCVCVCIDMTTTKIKLGDIYEKALEIKKIITEYRSYQSITSIEHFKADVSPILWSVSMLMDVATITDNYFYVVFFLKTYDKGYFSKELIYGITVLDDTTKEKIINLRGEIYKISVEKSNINKQ